MFVTSKKAIKWTLHLLYWLAYWLITIDYMVKWLLVNHIQATYYKITLYVSVYLFILIVFVYSNYLYLFPKYFMSKKYVKYVGCIVISGAIGVIIKVYIDIAFLASRPLWAYSLDHYLSSILPFAFNLILVSVLCLGEAWFRKLALETQLKNVQLEAELKWLKSQLDPHFLFNALNNIYTLAYLKSQDAAPKLLKLSEMMRYMLEDANLNSVPIEKEVSYMQNYISLHQLKQKKPGNIIFEVQNGTVGCFIQPLLFINFVENCFKHGGIEEEEAWIRLCLVIKKEQIIFKATNSVLTKKKPIRRQNIGIANAKKRLEILYPGKHQITIKEEGNVFSVHIILQRL